MKVTTQCQSNVSFSKLTLSYGLVFKEDRVLARSYMPKSQTNTMRNAFKCFLKLLLYSQGHTSKLLLAHDYNNLAHLYFQSVIPTEMKDLTVQVK